jgi:hypothetical protein
MTTTLKTHLHKISRYEWIPHQGTFILFGTDPVHGEYGVVLPIKALRDLAAEGDRVLADFAMRRQRRKLSASNPRSQE